MRADFCLTSKNGKRKISCSHFIGGKKVKRFSAPGGWKWTWDFFVHDHPDMLVLCSCLATIEGSLLVELCVMFPSSEVWEFSMTFPSLSFFLSDSSLSKKNSRFSSLTLQVHFPRLIEFQGLPPPLTSPIIPLEIRAYCAFHFLWNYRRKVLGQRGE